jgi:hypothetical protein
MNFLEAPEQSPTLLMHGLAPPVAVNDAAAVAAGGQPLAAKRARRSAASLYQGKVQVLALNGAATEDDLHEATLYEHGVYCAELLPSIQRSVPAVNAAQVAAALQPQFLAMSNQFARMDAQMVQASVRHTNAFADRDDCLIAPMEALPVLPPLGQPMAPVGLPPRRC